MAAQSDKHPLDRQRNHTEVEAYLVLAQLSYRAGVTRHSPPALGRLRDVTAEIGSPTRERAT